MDSKKDGFGLPISGILMVMTIFGAIWYYNLPLKGTRPTADKISELPVSRIQGVPARLWQDPFAAINEDGKKCNHIHDISKIGIREKIEIEGVNELIILGVMVLGGPYAEDAEWRLRMRYAAVSALGRLNYQPEDSQHIGYFNFQLDGTSTSSSDVGKKQLELKIDIEPDLSDDEKQLKFEWNVYPSSNPDEMKPLCIPFEWFKKEAPSTALLLLWLNDDEFYKNPLQRLSHLVKEISRLIQTEGNNAQKINPKIKIFGPAGSTTLKAMIEDVRNDNTNNSSLEGLNNVQIYSPFATADNPQLLGTSTGKNISAFFYEKGKGTINLIRTIRSDKVLLNSVIKELGRRKVDFMADNKCHIALIGEWDTFYSRSMRESFFALLRDYLDFRVKEFKPRVTIEKLYKAINDDNYNIPIKTTNNNTIDWLNELLKVPNFYEILHGKKLNIVFSKNITDLVDKTKDNRNKRFSDLSNDVQNDIKRLNRFLLEETYPETPKMLTSITFHENIDN